nr:hypothetical protein [Tanacetum cinerariifolium]
DPGRLSRSTRPGRLCLAGSRVRRADRRAIRIVPAIHRCSPERRSSATGVTAPPPGSLAACTQCPESAAARQGPPGHQRNCGQPLPLQQR